MIVNRQINCKSIEEFNKQLEIAKNICFAVFFEKYEKQSIRQNAYVYVANKYIYLTYKLYKQKITYKFNLNDEIKDDPNVLHIMSEINKVSPVQKVKDYLPEFEFNQEKFGDKKIGYRANIGSAKPIRNANFKKFGGKATLAYEYDLSSAYGQFLKEDLPDLSTVRKNAVIENENQVGFIRYGCTMHGFPGLIMITTVGAECDFVFDLMKSPYANWCDKIMKAIADETDKIKRDNLKNRFRIAVGQFQNHNPFWRAIIVEKCNKLINSLLDDNSIYWSTDSIVSSVKRDEEIMSTGYIWKVKNKDKLFKLHKSKLAYQWNNEIPIINGTKKLAIEYYNRTHEKPFDLLTDEMPTDIENKYYLDRNELKLKLNESWKED